MQLPQVRMQSKLAKIQITQTPVQQTIVQPKADQTIRQPKAEITIQRRPSKMTIDQSKAWEDMNLKSAAKSISEAAQKGKEAVYKGMQRRVSQGEQLMKIENGGNPIAVQGKQNGEKPMKHFNIGWIPSHFAVKTDYQPSELKINVQTHEPIIENKPNKPIINNQPGEVETSLLERQSLSIDFNNLKFKNLNFEMMI
ncbi:DUF6470 family protein [Sediminibacillus halophilus]|uniref:Uncharacterized protein n=1 Tax=Sediminibacillus halophilus TaxID=482461 RepID=A0A1G9RCQ8_9BACI|nr:DUF6470 family protein [Sediminibacillus halophilus]SDM20941.1 hypothetical protein SAMN05216244_1928 [Sediminibacillus halophilus]